MPFDGKSEFNSFKVTGTTTSNSCSCSCIAASVVGVNGTIQGTEDACHNCNCNNIHKNGVTGNNEEKPSNVSTLSTKLHCCPCTSSNDPCSHANATNCNSNAESNFKLTTQLDSCLPKPKAKMRSLNWSKIPINKVVNSPNVWSMLASDESVLSETSKTIDFQLLEGLFCQPIPKSAPNSKPGSPMVQRRSIMNSHGSHTRYSGSGYPDVTECMSNGNLVSANGQMANGNTGNGSCQFNGAPGGFNGHNFDQNQSYNEHYDGQRGSRSIISGNSMSGHGSTNGSNGNNGSSDAIDGSHFNEVPILNLLDSKKSLNVNIFLKQFRESMEEIISFIRSGEHEKIGCEALSNLLKLLPSESEKESLLSHANYLNRLPLAEKFLLKLIQIPNYKLIIECLILREEFDTCISSLEPSVNLIKCAASEIETSSGLRELFLLVLMSGNFLNSGGYAGDAVGFKVMTLVKLPEIRANKPGISLIHFVAQEMEKRNMATFYTQLPSLEEAAKTSIESLKADVDGLLSKINQISNCLTDRTVANSSYNDHFFQKMNSFIQKSKIQVLRVEKSIKCDLEEVRISLATFLCEEPSDFKLEECLKTLYTFIQGFKIALEENKRRKETEQRLEARRVSQQQLAAAAAAAGGGTSGKPRSTYGSRPQSLELSGDLDVSLFEFLRCTGSNFEGSTEGNLFGCTLRRSGRRSRGWRDSSDSDSRERREYELSSGTSGTPSRCDSRTGSLRMKNRSGTRVGILDREVPLFDDAMVASANGRSEALTVNGTVKAVTCSNANGTSESDKSNGSGTNEQLTQLDVTDRERSGYNGNLVDSVGSSFSRSGPLRRTFHGRRSTMANGKVANDVLAASITAIDTCNNDDDASKDPRSKSESSQPLVTTEATLVNNLPMTQSTTNESPTKNAIDSTSSESMVETPKSKSSNASLGHETGSGAMKCSGYLAVVTPQIKVPPTGNHVANDGQQLVNAPLGSSLASSNSNLRLAIVDSSNGPIATPPSVMTTAQGSPGNRRSSSNPSAVVTPLQLLERSSNGAISQLNSNDTSSGNGDIDNSLMKGGTDGQKSVAENTTEDLLTGKKGSSLRSLPSKLPIRTSRITSLPLSRQQNGHLTHDTSYYHHHHQQQQSSTARRQSSSLIESSVHGRYSNGCNLLTRSLNPSSLSPVLNSSSPSPLIRRGTSFRLSSTSPSPGSRCNVTASSGSRSNLMSTSVIGSHNSSPGSSRNRSITYSNLRYQTPLPKTSLVMRTTAKNAYSPTANFKRASLVASACTRTSALIGNGLTTATNNRINNRLNNRTTEVTSSKPTSTSLHLSSYNSYTYSPMTNGITSSSSGSNSRTATIGGSGLGTRRPSFTCEFRSFMKQTSSSAAKASMRHH